MTDLGAKLQKAAGSLNSHGLRLKAGPATDSGGKGKTKADYDGVIDQESPLTAAARDRWVCFH